MLLLSDSCAHDLAPFASWRRLLLSGVAVALGVAAWSVTAAENASTGTAGKVVRTPGTFVLQAFSNYSGRRA